MKTIEEKASGIVLGSLDRLERKAREVDDPFERLKEEIECVEHCLEQLKKIETDEKHQFENPARASRMMFSEELAVSALIIAGIERNFARM